MSKHRRTESVWEYPRPPIVVESQEHVEVLHGGLLVAETTSALRLLETSHPPTYYLPRSAFAEGVLRPRAGVTWCEWKGQAAYFDIVVDDLVAAGAAWTYPEPRAEYAELRDHVAVYPGRVDRCRVDGEVVVPQRGDFYGGWITSRVSGPFKGAPGTQGW